MSVAHSTYKVVTTLLSRANLLRAIPHAFGAAVLAVAGLAWAEEGVWTFDQPPSKALHGRYGFTPQGEWLDRLRLSAVNVGGASGSFISADGLVLTNHHVAFSCVHDISTQDIDLVKNGFLARSRGQERRCPGAEVRRLESFEDVSEKIRSATKPSDEAAVANAKRNAAIATIENDCKSKTGLRCEVVALYRGAAYQLYRYRVWTDVRLVFAPEARVGSFGGDSDNFVFPRFDLDVSLMRVYDQGKPVNPVHYLKWAKRGASEGELVFAAGHPHSTDRLLTVAQLAFHRDVRYPLLIGSAQRQRQVLQQFSARSAEAARRAENRLLGTENWLKAMRGEYKALKEPGLFARKNDEEARLRKLMGDAVSQRDPWARIESATRKDAQAFKESHVVSYGYKTLFNTAGRIVELANERALPDGRRLYEYRELALPKLLLQLTSEAPIYKDLEIARLTGYWQESVDLLGKDHAFVKRVLNGQTPLAAATGVIDATRIDAVDERKKLIEGGLAAVAASSDPLIVLARDIYPLRRRLAKFQEIEVETPIRQAHDELAQVRFKHSGADVYPDATASLRLSYGTVRGYDADGILTPWRTNFWGLFARHAAFDGQPPFDLPQQWLDKQRDLALGTPLNFVATLDIIGGSSGSPVVNRNGELVGLIFDGNLEGLGARFLYREEKARAIAVDSRAVVEALTKIYGADQLIAEIVPESGAR